MTQEEKKETKDKIIEQARLLFSQLGFRGTSVRMIAEKSDVNIAAINYHFGSKDNLYWFVMNEAYDWLENGVKTVTQESKGMEDFVIKMFRYMRSERHYILSTMKTFWSDAAAPPSPDHPYYEKLEKEQMGPPGSEYVIKLIFGIYPNAPEKAVQWAVMCLFSSIFHFATFTCTNHFENMKKEHMPVEQIEENLTMMATALMVHVNDPSKWS